MGSKTSSLRCYTSVWLIFSLNLWLNIHYNQVKSHVHIDYMPLLIQEKYFKIQHILVRIITDGLTLLRYFSYWGGSKKKTKIISYMSRNTIDGAIFSFEIVD